MKTTDQIVDKAEIELNLKDGSGAALQRKAIIKAAIEEAFSRGYVTGARDQHREDVAAQASEEPPLPIYCDICGRELQRESCNHVRPCPDCSEPSQASERPCTCHPDDNPPVPCQHKYALNDCIAAAQANEGERVIEVLTKWINSNSDALTADEANKLRKMLQA